MKKLYHSVTACREEVQFLFKEIAAKQNFVKIFFSNEEIGEISHSVTACRIGFNLKALITGDITQTDLPTNKISGLVEVKGVLKNIDDIKFIYFTQKEVVRHKLVQDIIKAYEIFETNNK